MTAQNPSLIVRIGAISFWRAWLAFLGCVLIWPAAAQQPGGKAMHMTLESTAFAGGKPIPRKYTGDGEDVSPPLTWKEVPAGAKELALVCDDPDAPSPKPWVHWLIYKIPARLDKLPEHLPVDGELTEPVAAMQGKNSWSSGRTVGYRGPSPPKGPAHHYHFKLYALDAPLAVKPGIDKAALETAMQGHILADAELIGTYGR